MFTVRYTYLRPSPAGPFKGQLDMKYRVSKGDIISATFGAAKVTSCRKVKDKKTPGRVP